MKKFECFLRTDGCLAFVLFGGCPRPRVSGGESWDPFKKKHRSSESFKSASFFGSRRKSSFFFSPAQRKHQLPNTFRKSISDRIEETLVRTNLLHQSLTRIWQQHPFFPLLLLLLLPSRKMTSCSNTKECGASSAKPEKKEEAKAQKSAPATTKPAEAKPAAGKPTEAKPAEVKAPAPAAKPTEAKAAAPAAKPEAKKTEAKK
jgi:hypothetical protein